MFIKKIVFITFFSLTTALYSQGIVKETKNKPKNNKGPIATILPIDSDGTDPRFNDGGTVIQDPSGSYTSFIVTDTKGNTNTYNQYINGNFTTIISTPQGSKAIYAYQNLYGQESLLVNNQYQLTWTYSNGNISRIWIDNVELCYLDSSNNWIMNLNGYSIWQNCKANTPLSVIEASTSITNYLSANQTTVVGEIAVPMKSRWGCGWAVTEYIVGWGAILACPETFGIGCAVGLVLHVKSGVGIATSCN